MATSEKLFPIIAYFALQGLCQPAEKNLATPPNAVLYNHSQLQLTPETN